MIQPRISSRQGRFEAPSIWAIFLLATGFQLLWLSLGPYALGMWATKFDPVILSAFAIVCALVILGQGRRGFRLSVRGVVALVALAALLTFAAVRPLSAVSETSEISLIVTVRDAASGRPLPGALLTASDGDRVLAESLTDDRGRAILNYRFWATTSRARAMSWRDYHPKVIQLGAAAEGYTQQIRALEHATEYRIKPSGKSFGFTPASLAYETKMLLHREESLMGGRQHR